MRHRRPQWWVWSLLSLLLLWLGSVPASAQVLPAPQADDFCATTSVELQCPRTELARCYCSLNSRSCPSTGEVLVAFGSLAAPKLPRYRPALRRLLAEFDSLDKLQDYHPPVPTEPPQFKNL